MSTSAHASELASERDGKSGREREKWEENEGKTRHSHFALDIKKLGFDNLCTFALQR
jgi:hypothetical protein